MDIENTLKEIIIIRNNIISTLITTLMILLKTNT